ncbi:glucosamine kinase [Paenibacillus sp. DS2015]|uniref:N-acetylglucosamine kinase n=1 Tax=Paenibacillus sp. DS2015 TaxID=3373917 RepID=UPI003D215483
MSDQVVIGIDGGGSHTRIVVADLRGTILSYVVKGGSNPFHHEDAGLHLTEGISEALLVAGRRVEDVAAMTAGLAGLDEDKDYQWAQEQLSITGISGVISIESDALTAQVGAFRGEPGIVAICGTGSVIYGRNEEGTELRNYQFQHYAPAAARFLGYEVVHLIIAGQYGSDDLQFVHKILDFWQCTDVHELVKKGAKGFDPDAKSRNRLFGQLAPLITLAAEQGIPLACQVCDSAAASVAIAIRLVGSGFSQPEVSISFIGSVLLSSYMQNAVEQQMSVADISRRRYVYHQAYLSPVVGAALHAYRKIGVNPSWECLSLLDEDVKQYTH